MLLNYKNLAVANLGGFMPGRLVENRNHYAGFSRRAAACYVSRKDSTRLSKDYLFNCFIRNYGSWHTV